MSYITANIQKVSDKLISGEKLRFVECYIRFEDIAIPGKIPNLMKYCKAAGVVEFIDIGDEWWVEKI
jgi:hypothetical protein